jgi:hypothetical protein
MIGGRGTEIEPGQPAPPVPLKLPVVLQPLPPGLPGDVLTPALAEPEPSRKTRHAERSSRRLIAHRSHRRRHEARN